jgi:CRISPR-associated protein Csd1
MHLKELADTKDPGLLALLHFVKKWTPDWFRTLGWPEDMKDQNVVFALESERRANVRIHDRPAARALWARLTSAGKGREAICLVSGERRPIARIHPPIKGIISPGAPKGSDSLISFNEAAFESYLHKQGDNAPISEAVAFAYTTALNKFLQQFSPHPNW